MASLLCRTISTRRLSAQLVAATAVRGSSHSASGSGGSDGLTRVDDVDAFITGRMEKSIAKGGMSREAQANVHFLLSQMPPSVRQMMQRELDGIGDTDYDNLTPHQRLEFSRRFSNATSAALATTLRHSTEQGQHQEQIARGESTGENYWMEASDFFSDVEIPSFLKDEVFEDMKRDRAVDPVLGVTVAEFISEADRELQDSLREEMAIPRAEREALPDDDDAVGGVDTMRDFSGGGTSIFGGRLNHSVPVGPPSSREQEDEEAFIDPVASSNAHRRGQSGGASAPTPLPRTATDFRRDRDVDNIPTF